MDHFNSNQVSKIIKNTAWLSGFFDAEGYWNIMNKTTLAFHLGQKQREILQAIRDAHKIGHVRYDKYNNFWIYSVTDKEGIRFLLKFFTKHKLHTQKSNHIFTFKRLLFMIDNKYHLNDQNTKKYNKIFNLISLFKKKI